MGLWLFDNVFFMTYNNGMTKEKASKLEKNKVAEHSNSAEFLHENENNSDGALVVASLKKTQIDEYDELETYKKFVKKRRKRLIGRIVTFVLLLVIAPLMIFLGSVVIDKNGKHDFFGYNFFIVVSDSMEPDIMVNDCVALKHVSSSDELEIGNDIGYIDTSGRVIVHRITHIQVGEDGEKIFKTKGINTTQHDVFTVKFEDIIGKKCATLRVLGNSVVFFRSPVGIAVLVTIFIIVFAGFYVAFRLSENITYVDQVTKKQD